MKMKAHTQFTNLSGKKNKNKFKKQFAITTYQNLNTRRTNCIWAYHFAKHELTLQEKKEEAIVDMD